MPGVRSAVLAEIKNSYLDLFKTNVKASAVVATRPFAGLWLTLCFLKCIKYATCIQKMTSIKRSFVEPLDCDWNAERHQLAVILITFLCSVTQLALHTKLTCLAFGRMRGRFILSRFHVFLQKKSQPACATFPARRRDYGNS